MNTDTHLDVEELLAGVAGDRLSEQSREHLARCPDCQAERARWAKLSAGTQQLTAATDLPGWKFPAEPAAFRDRKVA